VRVLGCAGVACGGATAEPVTPEPAPVEEPAPPEQGTDVEAVAGVLVHRDGAITLVDGERAQRVRGATGDALSEMGRGSTSPMVSLDGQRIAYVRDGRVWVSARDGSDPRPADVNPCADSTAPVLTAWSSDGSGFVFALTHFEPAEAAHPAILRQASDAEKPQGSGAMAMPTCEGDVGFFWWTGEGSAVRVAGLEDLATFAPSPRCFLRSTETGIEEVCLSDTGQIASRTERHRATRPGQIATSGDHVCWLADNALWCARIDGEPTLVARGAFAEYQWPMLSPDQHHVIFRHQDQHSATWEVRAFPEGEPRALSGCSGRCFARWDGATVLVNDPEGIRRMTLDGEVAENLGPGTMLGVGLPID